MSTFWNRLSSRVLCFEISFRCVSILWGIVYCLPTGSIEENRLDKNRVEENRVEENRVDKFRGEESLPTLTLPRQKSGGYDDIGDIFHGLQLPDDAKQAHDMLISWLESKDFICKREYYVPDRGDGHRGKIDVYAQNDGTTLAIEIDRNSPREKSVKKLLQAKTTHKIIVLRNGQSNFTIDDGIHVISVNHQASKDNLPPAEINQTKTGRENSHNKTKSELREIRNSFDFGEALSLAVNSWIKYKHEKNEAYKPRGLHSLLVQVKKNADLYGDVAVVNAIDASMAANYMGIVWDKAKAYAEARASPCGKILRNVETKNERNARVLNEFIGKVDPRFFDEEVADDAPKLGVVP